MGELRFTKTTHLNLATMRDEIYEYLDVLMGRDEPPIENGLLTLMEVADAYYCRAKEMEMEILAGENDGSVVKGGHLYKFRTGELRSFLDIAKARTELGSRRVTAAKIEYDAVPGSSL